MRLFLIIASLMGYGLDVNWIRFSTEVQTRWSIAGRILGPDDLFSIQEVLNHLDAVAHLSSSTLGHRNDSATNLARLNIVD